MEYFKYILHILFPMLGNDEVDFYDTDDDYYLKDSEQSMTMDTLSGGDVYHEPDYRINY